MRTLLAALLILASPPSSQAFAQKVSFRQDHTILVDDKPFFPIGLYYCNEEFEDPTGKLLTELRDYGFNTAGFYRWGEPTWRKELELADKLGLKVWIRGINGLAVDSPATEWAWQRTQIPLTWAEVSGTTQTCLGCSARSGFWLPTAVAAASQAESSSSA